MNVSSWNPATSRPVIASVPVYQPPTHQVDKMYMLFYSMIGGFASVVQTHVTDTFNLIKEDKKLFRFAVKKKATDSKRMADEIIATFRHYMQEIQMYQLWLDMTDGIEDDIVPDVKKCFFALDNQFMKFKIEEHKLYTNVLIAEILSKMLQQATDEFINVFRKMHGFGAVQVSEKFLSPIRGLHTRLRELMQLVYPEEIDNKVFAETGDRFNLGFEVIGLKVLDWKRMEKHLCDAIALNGLNLDKEDGSHISEYIDNQGTPWNETQIRALKTGYNSTSTEELAKVVGRTPAAVRAKARQLGLKKLKK
jgi:hypothetical protein